jgi:hypothetical protein
MVLPGGRTLVMPGKRMTQEQRDEAVRQVAAGASYSHVARLYGKDVRTIERLFRPGAPLRTAVERLLRERELAGYEARRKKAARSNGVLPIPTHPDVVREMNEAMATAAVEVRERQRVAQPPPVPAKELTDDQAEALWHLNISYRSGRLTDDEYNKRFDAIVYGIGPGGRVPQVRLLTIPRPSEALDLRPPRWAAVDEFAVAGAYGPARD